MQFVKLGNIEYVKKSLNQGINIDIETDIGDSALKSAIKSENNEIILYLINQGAATKNLSKPTYGLNDI